DWQRWLATLVAAHPGTGRTGSRTGRGARRDLLLVCGGGGRFRRFGRGGRGHGPAQDREADRPGNERAYQDADPGRVGKRARLEGELGHEERDREPDAA